MLRFQSDVRTIIFMILTTAILIILWKWSSEMNTLLFSIVYSAQLLMAISVSTMTHNHQHLPMWKKKWLNILTDNWLTVFYGFPVFAWIPTHNLNHHRHINTEEDYTKTYRYSESNNLLTLLSYPSISGYFQQKVVGSYLWKLKSENKKKFYFSCIQITSLVLWIAVGLIVDWRKALLYIVIPQQLSLFIVLIFNYVQHIHADEEDPFNNSRNFTGSILNYILLNNGYHTAHHVSTGLHWSQLPEKHRELAPKIDPILNEDNMGWYFFRNYILGIFIPSCRTHSLRVERIEKNQMATTI
jgi:beta-carotene hydroxylase